MGFIGEFLFFFTICVVTNTLYLSSLPRFDSLRIASTLCTIVIIGHLILFDFGTVHMDPHATEVTLDHGTTGKGLTTKACNRVPRRII